ncbi:hypothetical protein NLN94_21545 [Citrobacter portucalensis]|nr:hypothetical protein [Citrobacter portucalensis]MCX9039026.1 hypothetical protein [Citrobacter portucalensis]MCX9063504.1 hypothetical protein [Citrobacter portucalensis]
MTLRRDRIHGANFMAVQTHSRLTGITMELTTRIAHYPPYPKRQLGA